MLLMTTHNIWFHGQIRKDIYIYIFCQKKKKTIWNYWVYRNHPVSQLVELSTVYFFFQQYSVILSVNCNDSDQIVQADFVFTVHIHHKEPFSHGTTQMSPKSIIILYVFYSFHTHTEIPRLSTFSFAMQNCNK